MKPSVAPPPPDPGVAGRSKDPTPSGAPLTPDPVSAEHERMQQTIIRDVPILTPEAARALLEDASRRGVPLGHPLDAGLFAAGRGFEGMDQASLDELTRLVAGVWEARSAAEVIRIQAYLQHARTGEPLSPGQVEAGRAMFTEGVRSLAPAVRKRLADLLGRAIEGGILGRRKAEERTRLAALNPVSIDAAPTPAATPTSPRRHPLLTPHPTRGAREQASRERREPSPSGRGESYWRSRAASARAAVERAKARVRALEDQLARMGPNAGLGTTSQACVEGAPYSPGEPIIAFRDSTKGMVTCDTEILAMNKAKGLQGQLEAAREALRNAQEALNELPNEARRDGALPGWLR